MKPYNLDYLKTHSPNNPKFVIDIVNMFLSQTPQYLAEMKKCLADTNWVGLHGNAHKIRPSIHLIGMSKNITADVKQIEEYCKELKNLDLIPSLFNNVELAFLEVYKELEEELTHANL